jgi:hypothetical protein
MRRFREWVLRGLATASAWLVVVAMLGCPPQGSKVDMALFRAHAGELRSAFVSEGAAERAITRQVDYLEISLDTASLGRWPSTETVFLGVELLGVTDDARPLKAVVALASAGEAAFDQRLRVAAWPYSGRVLHATFVFRSVPVADARPLVEMLRSDGTLGGVVLDPARPETLSRAQTHYDAIIGGVSAKRPMLRYSFALTPLDALEREERRDRARVLTAGRYVLLLVPRAASDSAPVVNLERKARTLRLKGNRLVHESTEAIWLDSPYLVLRISRRNRYPHPTAASARIAAAETMIIDGDVASAEAKLRDARAWLTSQPANFTVVERQFWHLRSRGAAAWAKARKARGAADTGPVQAALARALDLYRQLRVDQAKIARGAEPLQFERFLRLVAGDYVALRRRDPRTPMGPLREVLLAARRAGVMVGVAPPEVSSTEPVSPSRSSFAPIVRGRGVPGHDVKIFARDDCGGAPIGSAVVRDDGSFEVPVRVAPNTTTRLCATQLDAKVAQGSAPSEVLSFVHDDLPPDAPGVTLPPSPSAARQVELRVVVAEPGRVQVHLGGGCAGMVLATRAPNAAGALAIAVTVPDNTRTILSVSASDVAGNRACSIDHAFEHDDRPPPPPILEATDPSSPSQEVRPAIVGKAEPGARVRVFLAPDCRGTASAEGRAGSDGRFRVPVAVTDSATVVLSARALDLAGNVSDCTAEMRYTHDRTPPAPPKLAARVDGRAVIAEGDTEAAATVLVYAGEQCRVPSATVVADPRGAFRARWEIAASEAPPSKVSVLATDRAGNASECTRRDVVLPQKTVVEKTGSGPTRDTSKKDAEKKDAEKKDAEKKDAEKKDAEKKDAEKKDAEKTPVPSASAQENP